jgi:hypothetical protein
LRADGRHTRHRRQDNVAVGEAFSRTHGPIIVIPGLDPGIQADSVGWGDPRIDPRIKSGDGDDEDDRSILHLDLYLDADGDTPGDHDD